MPRLLLFDIDGTLILVEELQAPAAAGRRVMPGVSLLLEALTARHHIFFLALLTGNYSEPARITRLVEDSAARAAL